MQDFEHPSEGAAAAMFGLPESACEQQLQEAGFQPMPARHAWPVDWPRPDWVFGYGSLLWDPGFVHVERVPARVRGLHRQFCIRSTLYRGTPDRPGLVLGLVSGGSCRGIVFRLDAASRDDALDRLYAREMPTRVYRPRLVACQLDDGRHLHALTFVANPRSPHYLRPGHDELIDTLDHCRGARGANRDYAINTWRALKAEGIHDRTLERVVQRLMRCGGTGE